ncbi:MAG: histidine triad nucleotide-binding protein [Parcubacteria group bacterium]|nr:MAG: histidine triad nucleotide-binding protein [Parcubacteria group bacterium]
MNCIFCQIAKKELPATIIHEDEKVVAFKDINPIAPIHYLIIPKKHIESVNQLEPEDKELMGELFLVAKKIAKTEGIADNGYRLVFNVGKNSGQMVDHLHLHLLGGKKLLWS